MFFDRAQHSGEISGLRPLPGNVFRESVPDFLPRGGNDRVCGLFPSKRFIRSATVPGDLTEVEFIEKDSKRFSDTHGWGYGMFDYDASSGRFAPATLASKPPQGHDAKCGAACHTLAASKDYIFTDTPKGEPQLGALRVLLFSRSRSTHRDSFPLLPLRVRFVRDPAQGDSHGTGGNTRDPPTTPNLCDGQLCHWDRSS
jgi:hypothetical protein